MEGINRCKWGTLFGEMEQSNEAKEFWRIGCPRFGPF